MQHKYRYRSLWGAYNDRDCVKDLLIKCFFFKSTFHISLLEYGNHCEVLEFELL